MKSQTQTTYLKNLQEIFSNPENVSKASEGARQTWEVVGPFPFKQNFELGRFSSFDFKKEIHYYGVSEKEWVCFG